ncbi:MAG: hypothetical protein KGQ51_14480 [Planctomycetes bacterium]|nr:hypothetical protein [Planctomycetota bacterium]
MNEPNQGPDDCELDNELVDSLRILKPRVPRLDWDAIRAAQLETDATIPASTPCPPQFSSAARIAVAWWSGMAAGVAITFFAMQWFVLRDLRAQVAQLEQTVIATTKKNVESSSAQATIIVNTGNFLDLNALLDTPNLSVGSYRWPIDRMVYVRSKSLAMESTSKSAIDDATGPQSTDTSGNRDPKIEPAEPPVNRLQWIKDLQREVY